MSEWAGERALLTYVKLPCLTLVMGFVRYFTLLDLI